MIRHIHTQQPPQKPWAHGSAAHTQQPPQNHPGPMGELHTHSDLILWIHFWWVWFLLCSGIVSHSLKRPPQLNSRLPPLSCKCIKPRNPKKMWVCRHLSFHDKTFPYFSAQQRPKTSTQHNWKHNPNHTITNVNPESIMHTCEIAESYSGPGSWQRPATKHCVSCLVTFDSKLNSFVFVYVV